MTDRPDLPLVALVGSNDVHEAATEAGLDPSRILQIVPSVREDRATVLHRAGGRVVSRSEIAGYTASLAQHISLSVRSRTHWVLADICPSG